MAKRSPSDGVNPHIPKREPRRSSNATGLVPSAPQELPSSVSADHSRFIDEYLVDRNATRAYLAVYPESSYAAARVSACRLLADANIGQIVSEREEILAAGVGLTQNRIREELAILSFSSIDNYVIDDDGKVEVAAHAPDGCIRAVQSIKRKVRKIPREDGDDIVEIETEIKLWDKPGTVRMSGQHRKMFVEKHEHDVGGSLLEAIVGAAQRVER